MMGSLSLAPCRFFGEFLANSLFNGLKWEFPQLLSRSLNIYFVFSPRTTHNIFGVVDILSFVLFINAITVSFIATYVLKHV